MARNKESLTLYQFWQQVKPGDKVVIQSPITAKCSAYEIKAGMFMGGTIRTDPEIDFSEKKMALVNLHKLPEYHMLLGHTCAFLNCTHSWKIISLNGTPVKYSEEEKQS